MRKCEIASLSLIGAVIVVVGSTAPLQATSDTPASKLAVPTVGPPTKLAQSIDQDRLRNFLEQFRRSPDDQDREEQPEQLDQDNRDSVDEDEPDMERAEPGPTTRPPPARRATQPRQRARQAQPNTQTGQRSGTPSVRQETLARHNSLRARHCAPPLTWSGRLASIAQEWANRCVFEHRQGNLGENLAIGTSGAFPPASQVQSWYDEINSYDFARGQSREGQDIGHFTQVIWQRTTQVGCAVAACNGQDLLVCNYSPAGNLVGRYTQNVPRRCR